MNSNRVAIPTLVRINTGALGRMGIYLSRQGHRHVAVFQSAGLLDDISSRMRFGMLSASIEPIVWGNVAANEFEHAISYFPDLPRAVTAIKATLAGAAGWLCVSSLYTLSPSVEVRRAGRAAAAPSREDQRQPAISGMSSPCSRI